MRKGIVIAGIWSVVGLIGIGGGLGLAVVAGTLAFVGTVCILADWICN